MVLLAVAAVRKEGSMCSLARVFLLPYNGLLSHRLCLIYLVLLRLCGGLLFGKAGVVRRLVHMQLRIRVGVGSTRMKILGGRKITWGEGSCRRQ